MNCELKQNVLYGMHATQGADTRTQAEDGLKLVVTCDGEQFRKNSGKVCLPGDVEEFRLREASVSSSEREAKIILVASHHFTIVPSLLSLCAP